MVEGIVVAARLVPASAGTLTKLTAKASADEAATIRARRLDGDADDMKCLSG
jgi:hypothetical protein